PGAPVPARAPTAARRHTARAVPAARRRSRSRSSRSGGHRRAGAYRDDASSRLLLVIEIEHREERFLRDFDHADLLHPLLSRLLPLEQLALAGDVTAVTLRQHVLSPGLHRFARDHTCTDRGLDGDVEVLARDLLSQPFDKHATAVVGRVAVNDQRERVDRLAADEDVHAYELPRAEPDD